MPYIFKTIPGVKTFTGTVTASDSITVSGNVTANMVFGQDLDEFISEAVLLEGNQTITGRLIKCFLDGRHVQTIIYSPTISHFFRNNVKRNLKLIDFY